MTTDLELLRLSSTLWVVGMATIAGLAVWLVIRCIQAGRAP